MMGKGLRHVCLLGLLPLALACEDSEYHYPSVKLEFVTVVAGEDGGLRTLVPDKGDELAIANDYTQTSITPNSESRVLSNYEETEGENGAAAANIYSVQSLIVLEPLDKNDEEATAVPLGKDPVEVTSIWMGRDYLNMILNVKVKGDKPHAFRLLYEEEEPVDGERVFLLTLYHDANGDAEYYNRNAYVSVPLAGLAGDPAQTIRIKFKYYMYNEDGEVEESDKYCGADFEGFEYTPSAK